MLRIYTNKIAEANKSWTVRKQESQQSSKSGNSGKGPLDLDNSGKDPLDLGNLGKAPSSPYMKIKDPLILA